MRHRSRSAFPKGPWITTNSISRLYLLEPGINANHEMAGMGRKSESDFESEMKLRVTSHVTISEVSYRVSPLTESSRNVAASVADAHENGLPILDSFSVGRPMEGCSVCKGGNIPCTFSLHGRNLFLLCVL